VLARRDVEAEKPPEVNALTVPKLFSITQPDSISVANSKPSPQSNPRHSSTFRDRSTSKKSKKCRVSQCPS
jgi:hypothetical protein